VIDFSHPLTKLANFRDMGNLAGRHGSIRPGVLFRSDDVSTIDDDEAERLVSHDISLIIDLRSSDEVAGGRGPLANYDIDYLNLPILERSGTSQNLNDLMSTGVFTNAMMGQWYFDVFRKGMPMLIEGLQAVSEARGAVLFHCAIGKDRTGLFAVALHGALGTHRAHIVSDFAKTETNLDKVLARLTASQPFWTPEIMSKSGALLRAEAEAMHVFLDAIEEQGTDLEELLLAGGANPALLDTLRGIALTSGA
jgi:protein-tyrosine phosphatase